ncbi:MAG: hypothetical protein K2G88_01975 [Oscillospiraceae bacterium]|nr:hypothetical protein [Oscillospiraceae bacterium]
MNEYLTALKDVLVVLSPIIVAYISYRSNKKSKEDIRLEIEKSLKEKDAETYQIIQKINAELESQKQLATWNSSLPQTDEYTKLAGIERYGNICSLTQLVNSINCYIDGNNLSLEELHEVKTLLSKIVLPIEEDKLYTYEVTYIIDYNRLNRKIDRMINDLQSTN